MTRNRKAKCTEQRAHKRSAKQSAKARARQQYRKETPRSERIPASKTPSADFFSKAYTWFDLKQMRERMPAA